MIGKETPSHTIRTHRVLGWIGFIKAEFSRRLSVVQVRYKLDLDKAFRQEPRFKVWDSEFVDTPKIYAFLSNAGHEMASHRYINFLSRRPGPHKALSTLPHTVSVEEDGILNTLSIDRPMTSPTWAQVVNDPHETAHTLHLQQQNRQQQNAFKETKNAKNDSTLREEHMVSRLVSHVDTQQGYWCVVT